MPRDARSLDALARTHAVHDPALKRAAGEADEDSTDAGEWKLEAAIKKALDSYGQRPAKALGYTKVRRGPPTRTRHPKEKRTKA